MRCLLCSAIVLLLSSALQAEFVVGDADLQNGVYELRYYTQRNILVKNGVAAGLDSTPLGELFLTNTGNAGKPAFERADLDSGVQFLQATGAYGGWGQGVNSTWNTSAAATMGWNFSQLTGAIAKVELLTSQCIFQFGEWNDEALGDRIFADLATPAAFGAGSYTNIYSYTGDNADGTKPGAYASMSVRDITGLLAADWLQDPQKLELKFGYALVNTDIPGRHLQLFRDGSTSGFPDNSFMLRVTMVPEPGSLLLISVGMIGVFIGVGVARRRSNVRGHAQDIHS